MAAAASASAALELEGRGLEGRGALEGRITPLECHASSAAAGAAQLQRRASELQTRRHKLAQLEATFEPNPNPNPNPSPNPNPNPDQVEAALEGDVTADLRVAAASTVPLEREHEDVRHLACAWCGLVRAGVGLVCAWHMHGVCMVRAR